MPDVLVYRRPGCMFCEQVEELLRENRIPFRSEDIVDRDAQDRISRQYGALSFPLVLRDDEYVGGFTHIVQLHSEGRLRRVLADAPEVSSPSSRSASKLGSLQGYAALGALLQRKGSEQDADD